MYWHLTIAADERLTLFPSESLKRRAVRAVVRHVPSALLFYVADDHLHLVCRGDRAHVGRRAAALAVVFQPFAATKLASSRIRPVEGRAHLESLVGYVLRQRAHHRLPPLHPVRDTGSCFADLVGARALGFDAAPLREALPRLTREDLARAVGLQVPTTEEADSSLENLTQAAAELVGHDDLLGGAEALVPLRVALVHRARQLGFTNAALASALNRSERSVQRFAADDADPRLLAALRGRAAWVRAPWNPRASADG